MSIIQIQNEIKREILGYKGKYVPNTELKGYDQVISILSTLPQIGLVNRPAITLDDVITGSKQFYGKYFTVHDIAHVSIKTVEEKSKEFINLQSGAELASRFNSLTTMINPFDLPITLIEGNSMAGQTQKPLIVSAAPGYKGKVVIPFSGISLGENLTDLSIATHIHEVAHTQTESIPGYAENYENKEVISIFLEKLAALELDSTGELLRMSERMRYRYLLDMINKIKLTPRYRQMGITITEEDLINASSYINATLIATKLFDIYQKARKQKERDKMLRGIQQIFDGQITVEQFLSSYNITLAQSKDINLIKRHI